MFDFMWMKYVGWSLSHSSVSSLLLQVLLALDSQYAMPIVGECHSSANQLDFILIGSMSLKHSG